MGSRSLGYGVVLAILVIATFELSVVAWVRSDLDHRFHLRRYTAQSGSDRFNRCRGLLVFSETFEVLQTVLIRNQVLAVHLKWDLA
jgi:hypothetical protein